MKQFVQMMKDEDGQGMVEYGLILGLIAIVVVVALAALGPKVKGMFDSANSALTTTTAAG